MLGQLTRYILLLSIAIATTLGSVAQTTADSVRATQTPAAATSAAGSRSAADGVYHNIIKATNLMMSLPKAQREAKLRDYIIRHTQSKDHNKYKRIEQLFILCNYLGMSTRGELLTSYMEDLQALVDSLPSSDLLLKHLFYTEASDLYLSNSTTAQGLEANRRLLSIIDSLQRRSDTNTRLLYNYNQSAYKVYCRLLRHHTALTPAEIDEYLEAIDNLTQNNPDLRTPHNQKMQTIYKAVAQGNHAEAIPLITAQLKSTDNSEREKIYLVESLLAASAATGNTDLQQQALEMSNDMLKARIDQKATDSYNELQMMSEVYDLKHSNDELMQSTKHILVTRHKEQLTYTLLCLGIVLLLLAVVAVLYWRSKHLTADLRKSNALILEERNSLQSAQTELMAASDRAKMVNRMKMDFFKSMGHEIRTPIESIVEYSELIAGCSSPSKSESIKKYADIISLNADMLLTLVNDVLNLPSLEKAKTHIYITNTSIQRICTASISNAMRHLPPDVSIDFNSDGQPDTTIMTDPHRVEQVLNSLITNAAKFSNIGHVTLSYIFSPRRETVTFHIIATDADISAEKGAAIFSRNNAGSTSSSNNLDLYISRMLAEMLGGSLKLDRQFRDGIKFLFTIPII